MPNPVKLALFTILAPISYEMMTPVVPLELERKKRQKKGPVKGPYIFNY